MVIFDENQVVSDQIKFLCWFLGKLKTPKSRSEINWPLETRINPICFAKSSCIHTKNPIYYPVAWSSWLERFTVLETANSNNKDRYLKFQGYRLPGFTWNFRQLWFITQFLLLHLIRSYMLNENNGLKKIKDSPVIASARIFNWQL